MKVADLTSRPDPATDANADDVYDEEFKKNAAIIKQRGEERTREVKLKLMQWVDDHIPIFSDFTEGSIALVEIASERDLWLLEDAVEAGDFIHRIFLRVVRRRNGSLQ